LKEEKKRRKKLPLFGLTILVDIKDGKNDKSSSFHDTLYEYGAKVAKKFHLKVSLLIFSSTNTKILNKALEKNIPVVSPL